MTQYLISFDDGAMTFSEDDLPGLMKAARAVVEEAEDAGVWVAGGGVNGHEVGVVSTDGTRSDRIVTEGEQVGGFALVDVGSRDEALDWAAKLAAACSCTLEVRELLPDPDQW